MKQIEDAACGCPRYDSGHGIQKVHNDKCAERAEPKVKKSHAKGR